MEMGGDGRNGGDGGNVGRSGFNYGKESSTCCSNVDSLGCECMTTTTALGVRGRVRYVRVRVRVLQLVDEAEHIKNSLDEGLGEAERV